MSRTPHHRTSCHLTASPPLRQPKAPVVTPVYPHEYGYNQVFEQLFQAYEERLPERLLRRFARKGTIPRDQLPGYDCPGDRYLSLDFK